MRTGAWPPTARFLHAALRPRVEALATKLMSLSNLNRTVHLPTYNRLLGVASLDLQADLGRAESATPARRGRDDDEPARQQRSRLV